MRLLALAAVLLTSCSVDETGYFIPPEVDYSAPGILTTGADQEIFVVGRPGALTEGGGELTIESSRTTATVTAAVDDEVGSFAASLTGRLGDRIVLRYRVGDVEDELELTIDDALDQLPGLDCTICSGALVGAAGADGQAPVSLALLDDPTPPFVLVNLGRGITRIVEEVSPDPRIPASVGDTICVYRISADGMHASWAECADVPEP